jgi:hypothetical protein
MVDAEAVGRVGRLRAVEEAPVRSAPIAFPQPVEDPLLVPPGEDLLLEGGVIGILGERLEDGVILGSRGNLPVSPNPFPLVRFADRRLRRRKKPTFRGVELWVRPMNPLERIQ